MTGQTITLFQMDGNSEGRCKAEICTKTIVAYKIPRLKLSKSGDLDYIHTPGVYLLFGKEDDDGKPFVYVGEADDTFMRIMQPHKFEKSYYWTEAITFLSSGEFLDKTKVKYLEHRLYSIINNYNDYLVLNASIPTKPQLSRSVQDPLESFIEDIRTLTSPLGYKVFEVPTKKETDTDLLYLSRSGIKATGMQIGDKFWVLKGSQISPSVAYYLSDGYLKIRKEHEGDIKDGILLRDISFSSPSSAAVFVLGKSSNGLVDWKSKDNITLKKINEGSVSIEEEISPRINPSTNLDEIFVLIGRDVKAQGKKEGKGFSVLKGSMLKEKVVNDKSIKEKRAELITNGVIKEGIFVSDYLFSSPSSAAGVINGCSTNGKISWVDSRGLTLKEHEKEKEA